MAIRTHRLQVSLMGIGLLRQFGHLTRLRRDDVHHPSHSDQTTPRLQKEQDQALAGHVPRCLVSAPLLFLLYEESPN